MAQGEEEGRSSRRAYQSPFVPLVLLLTILAIVGYLNTNLVEPYTGPRAVASVRVTRNRRIDRLMRS